MVLVLRRLPFHQAGEEVADALGREEAVGEPIRHQPVELVHRDRPAFTGTFALPGAGRAGVVAIAAGLTRAQRHAAAASGAGGDAGQKNGPGDDARRQDFRVSGLERGLDGVECLSVDDRIDGDRNVISVGLGLAGLPDFTVEAVLSFICGARQNPVQLADAPARTEARPVAVLVKPACDGFDTHRAGRAVAFAEQSEYQPNDFGLDRIDREAFLGFRAALFGGNDGVAVRRFRAVPESLPGIFLHRAQRVLGVLFRLVFVEQGENLPNHDAHGIFAEILRDADKPDARLAQAAYMHLQREMIPRKPAEGMDENDIERRAAPGCHVEQALQFRAAVIRAAHTGLNEFNRNIPAASGAVGERLPPLVRDR